MNTKSWMGTADTYARMRAIERLDLDGEYWQIARLFLADFQSLMITQVYQGFLMTFAVPRMSRILAGTGEIQQRTAKRAIDTAILTRAVFLDGVNAGLGREAASRVNAMHRRFPIDPEDFIAVGVDGALTQIRLAESYGWRPVLSKEKEAVRRCFARITKAYGGPSSFPDSGHAMEEFWSTYRSGHFEFEPQNGDLAGAITAWFSQLVPAPARPLLRVLLRGTTDTDILRAVGMRPPTDPERRVASILMRRVIGSRDPLPDGAPDPLDPLIRTVYPNGYRIQDLGTFN